MRGLVSALRLPRPIRPLIPLKAVADRLASAVDALPDIGALAGSASRRFA